jgi:hypothetical protein
MLRAMNEFALMTKTRPAVSQRRGKRPTASGS